MLIKPAIDLPAITPEETENRFTPSTFSEKSAIPLAMVPKPDPIFVRSASVFIVFTISTISVPAVVAFNIASLSIPTPTISENLTRPSPKLSRPVIALAKSVSFVILLDILTILSPTSTAESTESKSTCPFNASEKSIKDSANELSPSSILDRSISLGRVLAILIIANPTSAATFIACSFRFPSTSEENATIASPNKTS